jgi:UDP-GlcNAc:undecaprenyl-phosphate/decaprenyl-phosphate GlcNAc-1-phosphate transferase
MELFPRLALTVLGTVVLTRLLMPVARRAGTAWGLVDHPSWRRRQKSPVPCSGGLAIYIAGVIAGGLLTWWVGVPFATSALLALAFGGLGTMILGVLDDRFGLHAEKKLLGQILVVSIPMAGGLVLDEIALPGLGTISLGLFAGPVTLFWYLGFINSVNLIDGLDGLAGGIVAIVAGTLVVAAHGGDPVGALFVGALLGAVAGFLRDNLSRERIFLGDAGSMLLGLWIAGLSLGLAKTTPALPAIAVFAMFVPVLDTSTTILRRWHRGVSVFRPDAEHLHHRLLALGQPALRATMTLWFATLAAASTGALLMGAPSAGVVAVAAAAAAAIELAYTLQHDRHPRLGRVVGYLLGMHPTLYPTDPVRQLADVIEMQVYRQQRVQFEPAAAAGASDGGDGRVVDLDPVPVEAVTSEHHNDVVLAVPEESPR